jgi:hypothetical protein
MFTKVFFLSLGLACSAAIFGATAKDTVVMPRDNTGKPLPRFINGFTIFYDRDLQTVLSYDAMCAPKINITLALPETSRITILDVTARKDGMLAVAASAYSLDQQQAALVVFLIKPGGQIDRVVRTNPFAATRIIFGSNGHLWAVGKVHDEAFKETAHHDILREYDEQGQLVRTMLSTDSFRTTSPPPAGQVLLVANRDRVGVYSQTANEYIEFDLLGNLAGRWSTPTFPKSTAIVGAALTATGIFCVGGITRGEDGKTVAYRFNRASGQFNPIDLPTYGGATQLVTLLGVEDNDLVLYGKPASITRVTLE